MHKAKARVVCQGNNVRDENGLWALFAEAASSASQIEASRMIDAISLLPTCSGSQADAVSAYTQAKLYGDGRVTKIDTSTRAMTQGMGRSFQATCCSTSLGAIRSPPQWRLLGAALH